MQTAPTSEPSTASNRLVLVDGSGYIFRAYHALPPLTRRDGTPVGAVLGYCNMLTKLIDSMHTDHIAVIFDKARLSFRNEIFADYKANRGETPEDLIPQFPIIREATKAFNIPSIEMENYEADDLIASYAVAAKAQGWEVVIVSSDKDLMQLIEEGICMHDPMKNKVIGPNEVMEKFGVLPEKVIEVQALIGDSVDNIPGVPGIGPKTAAQLIDEFGTLEQVLARACEIKQNKRRESLIEHADAARMSYELVKLKKDIPLPVPIDDLIANDTDATSLLTFLAENQFKSLLAKMEHRFGQSAPAVELAPMAAPAKTLNESSSTPAPLPTPPTIAHTNYTLVQNIDDLHAWIKRATAKGYVAFDCETTSLDATQATLVGVSLSIEAGEACYIPLNHVQAVEESSAAQNDLFGDSSAATTTSYQRIASQLSVDTAMALLKPLLIDDSVLKIGQNIKYDMLVLKQIGVEISPIADTMLMSYVAAAGLHAHNMDDLAERYLGVKTIPFKQVCGSGKSQITFDQVALDAACAYAAEDADITLRLYHMLKAQMIQSQTVSIYENYERALVPVLVEMENHGIKADPEFLKDLSKEFEGQMSRLEAEIHQLAGREFNIGSPKQLGDILYDEMKLEGGKKSSKTGAYATGADVLEELAAQGHALPEKVLEWRGLSKLKSTYTDALVKQINPKTGRIHTSFSMAVASTGRLSSSDPNLQNIPIRTEAGKRIRQAFIADTGNKLISADYSQIELRLLAHIAEIDVLAQAFRDGRDIHAATASQMFGVALDEVSSELRRKAKTINFGIIYGISAHGLATRLGIGRGEAKDYIDAYFEQYPGIRAYMEQTKEFAREHGYVKTLYGRKVHVKDIKASNPNLRAFSERAAINAPLQGTAADIIKHAMILVQEALAKRFPEARLLLQVHDELIVECPEHQAKEVAKLMQSTMQSAAHLSIPLLVEAGIGDNWGEIH